MTKKELRKMIQEEARREVYRILPDMLRETVESVLTESLKSQKPRRKTNAAAPRAKPRKKVSRESILEEIGYGEFARETESDRTMHFDSSDVHSVASRIPVPMDGGLRDKESQLGYAGAQYMGSDEDEFETAPQGVPNGIPDFLADAIGKAKKVYDAAENKSNYRPGRR